MAPRPIRLVDPFITLAVPDATPTPVAAIAFECFANGIHLTGEDDDDLATFCDPNGFAYTLSLDLKMSLGTGSLDDAFTKLGGPGTVVTFDFAYQKGAASVTNPHWVGKARLPSIPVVDAGINEATSFTIDMPVVGDITRSNGGAEATIFPAPANNPHSTDATDEVVAA